MKMHDATEQAYKNGFEKGFEEGLKMGSEKQNPKKPVDMYDDNVGTEECRMYEKAIIGYCPVCNQEVQDGMNYCMNCGQRLDWSEKSA